MWDIHWSLLKAAYTGTMDISFLMMEIARLFSASTLWCLIRLVENNRIKLLLKLVISFRAEFFLGFGEFKQVHFLLAILQTWKLLKQCLQTLTLVCYCIISGMASVFFPICICRPRRLDWSSHQCFHYIKCSLNCIRTSFGLQVISFIQLTCCWRRCSPDCT